MRPFKEALCLGAGGGVEIDHSPRRAICTPCTDILAAHKCEEVTLQLSLAGQGARSVKIWEQGVPDPKDLKPTAKVRGLKKRSWVLSKLIFKE